MRFGSYEVVEEIGSGGMASVYRARQPSVERDVAIKVMHKSVGNDDEGILRFQREARLIARLEHPHILPVYDFDGMHNPPYIVMRYLNGGTLKDIMTGALAFDKISTLLRQVGSALDYAHRQGVVHRDIKPSNIMIDREGNAFVTDFGIARIVNGGSTTITQAGTMVGTLDYMSPEQLMGNENIDHRADVYSFAVLVFQMLSGEVPFKAPSLTALAMRHIQEPVPSLSSRNSDVPDALDKVIYRAMAKNPAERHDSISEFVQEILETLGVGSHIILKSTRHSTTTQTKQMLSEQNKLVTVVHIDASQYAEQIEESESIEAALLALNTLWDEVVTIIENHQGEIIKREENRLTALWGMIVASEDDVELAAQAALHIYDLQPETAIGIHTGIALISPGNPVMASGSTLTLASRLAEHADKGILASPDTYRHLRGIFVIHHASSLRLRGRKEPLETYRILSLKERSTRVEAPQFEGVETKLIGREGELKLLQNAYLSAFEDSETQVITVIGAAGIGKSRLMYEFNRWNDLREEKVRIFRARATPTQNPYALLRELLIFRFRILEGDSAATAREKLENGLREQANGDAEMAAFIGQLAGFDFSDSPYIKGILDDPQQITRRARQLFVRFMGRMCEPAPVILYLEDLHYADDASLDLLTETFVGQQNARLMAVCLARPALLERRPDWGGGQVFHKLVTLQTLDKRDSRELVRELLQKLPDIPKELRDLLVDRAEGNPLYMEELVKMLIDDRIIIKGETWQVQESRLQNLRVPPTLVGLLQARLDTLLYPEKLVLQRASVIGRIFSQNAIEAIDRFDETHLDDIPSILSKLAQREFIYRRETSSASEYIFAQSMVRDTLYDNLLRRQYHAYHVGIAEWLIESSGERQDEYFLLIADHYERAGENEKAAVYLLQAADKAYAISGFHEAFGLLERAASLAEKNQDIALQSQLKMGRCHFQLGQLTEAKNLLEKALNLPVNNQIDAEMLVLLAEIMTQQGAFEEAGKRVEEARQVSGDDQQLLVKIMRVSGFLALSAGRYEQAKAELQQSLNLARTLNIPELIIKNLDSLGIAFFSQGDYAEELHCYDEGQQYARQIGNRAALCKFLGSRGDTMRLIGMLDESEQMTLEALAITRELGLQFYECLYIGNHALIEIERGNYEVAEQLLKQALKQAVTNGFGALAVNIVGNLGDVFARRGDVEQGLHLMGMALYHPSADYNTRTETERALKSLRERLGDEVVEAGLAQGALLDFDARVGAML